MSGPLRRLARQITSAAPVRLHTTARLPYAPVPETTSEPWPPSAPAPLADVANAKPARFARHIDREDADTAQVPAQATLAAPAQSTSSSAPGATPAPAPAAARASQAAERTQTAARQSARQAQVDGLPHPTARDRSAAGATDRVFAAPRLDRDAPQHDAASISTRAASRETGIGDDGPPPLLVTTRPAATRPAQTAQARNDPVANAHQSRRLIEQPSAPDDHEIHIHIGRIEVTALRESPSPTTPRKRKGREPMSLDDYLARRRKDQ
jgi:hypothetical protein